MKDRHASPILTLLRLIVPLAFSLAGTGCGSDSEGDVMVEDSLGQDLHRMDSSQDKDFADDTTPPEFRDVRVEIGSAPPIELDLNTNSVTRILPMPFPATFTILVKDDQTAAEQIHVSVTLEGSQEPVSGQQATFNNGLWTLSIPELGPGQLLRIHAQDAAGNASAWTNTLEIPSLATALTASWQTPFYNAQGQLQTTWNATWEADFTWEEIRSDPPLTMQGTWQLSESLLAVVETRSSGGDQDPETQEHKLEGDFYVDETYFSHLPMHRSGQGSGLEGTWTQTWKAWSATASGLQVAEDVHLTWVLNPNGQFQSTRTGLYPGDDDATQMMQGTWVEVPNENYIDNYGNYLVITVDEIDGAALDAALEQVDLAVIRNGLLLLSPKIRKL